MTAVVNPHIYSHGTPLDNSPSIFPNSANPRVSVYFGYNLMTGHRLLLI